MMLDNTERGFSITGVYHVHRGARTSRQRNRRHTAIAYRLKGESRFFYAGEELIADENSMIYIPAGADYVVRGREEELIVVHLKCFAETSGRIEILHGCTYLAELFLRLNAEWESGDAMWRHNRCMSILYTIFENAQKAKQQEDTALPEVIRPGVERMQREFKNSDITISALAETCRVSEVYFRRLYKEHFGVSPLEGLLRLRFSYAESLLLSGYYAVRVVSEMSGFTDVKYFRTAFTKRYGMTPSAFRRRQI